MEAVLTSKGQITVPKPVRDRLHAGDKFDFLFKDDDHLELVVKKKSLEGLKGLVPPPVTGISLEDMEQA